MKLLITILGIVMFSFSANAQQSKLSKASKPMVVDASCGQCNYGMKDAKGCDLAVKIDGKSYWVDGKTIHDLGDPHGAGGLCTTNRQAEVMGEIIDGRFKASAFKLLPLKSEKAGHEGHNHK
jgi:hypothetical protein